MFIAYLVIFWLLEYMVADLLADLQDSEDKAHRIRQNAKQIISGTASIAWNVAKAKVTYEAVKFGAKVFTAVQVGRLGYKAGTAIGESAYSAISSRDKKPKRGLTSKDINNRVRAGINKNK